MMDWIILSVGVSLCPEYTNILVPQWQTPYMDATGAFLDCYVIPWGRLSEEPGHG